MVFNFRLTQKLSPFFFAREGALFLEFFLPHRKRSTYFGRVQETVSVQSDYSINKLFIDIQPEKRKPTVLFFLNKGDIPL